MYLNSLDINSSSAAALEEETARCGPVHAPVALTTDETSSPTASRSLPQSDGAAKRGASGKEDIEPASTVDCTSAPLTGGRDGNGVDDSTKQQAAVAAPSPAAALDPLPSSDRGLAAAAEPSAVAAAASEVSTQAGSVAALSPAVPAASQSGAAADNGAACSTAVRAIDKNEEAGSAAEPRNQRAPSDRGQKRTRDLADGTTSVAAQCDGTPTDSTGSGAAEISEEEAELQRQVAQLPEVATEAFEHAAQELAALLFGGPSATGATAGALEAMLRKFPSFPQEAPSDAVVAAGV